MLRGPLLPLLLVSPVLPVLGLRTHRETPQPSAAFLAKHGALTCTTLKNHGSHFTARIEVGTPPQPFDVVADTGSDSVIVTSCVCMETKRCLPGENKCFRGSNHSSTFSIPAADFSTVPIVDLAFGSGQIEAVITSDVVRVGSTEARLDNGLLLMVNQALTIKGPFEGILGLGLPRPHHDGLSEVGARGGQNASGPAKASPATVRFLSEGWEAAQRSRGQGQLPAGAREASRPAGLDAAKEPPYASRSFLDAAGVSRFSMCFNDGSDGVLRLGPPQDPFALGSIGQVHWGLELRGFSVGSVSSPAVFCAPGSARRPGQSTACGAIPDSGTTVMMGPADHIRLLFTALCDGWERCRQSARKHWQVPKWEVFEVELMGCADWLGKEALPPLHIMLRGSQGNDRVLEIPPHLYIIEAEKEEVHQVTKHLMGIFPVQAQERTGRKVKVCTPAFGVMEYHTKKNGPVWVLGTPLFYAYQVGYDLKSTPPSISFAKAPCGTCSRQTSLYAGSAEIARHAPEGAETERPRPIRGGPLLVRHMDTSLPL
mmetsp:Transcript_27053/g.84178  ORF Transcript_27053/g.84178 Transcript_27053/m.84178 type:complete len:541 (-) Transcript_27053:93-1715(-)